MRGIQMRGLELLLACTMALVPGAAAGQEIRNVPHPSGDSPVFLLRHAPVRSLTMIEGVPRVLLQGNGDLLLPDPSVSGYETLRVRRLSESGVQQVLSLLLSTGEFDESRVNVTATSGHPSSTVFELWHHDRHVEFITDSVTHSASALTRVRPEAPTVFQAVRAIEEGAGFITPSGWVDDGWHEWQPRAMWLVQRRLDPSRRVNDAGILPRWPLGLGPDGLVEVTGIRGWMTDCAVVSGAEVPVWQDALRHNPSRVFTWGNEQYHVDAIVVAPGQEARCPEPYEPLRASDGDAGPARPAPR